jgi:hypothetical protein
MFRRLTIDVAHNWPGGAADSIINDNLHNAVNPIVDAGGWTCVPAIDAWS